MLHVAHPIACIIDVFERRHSALLSEKHDQPHRNRSIYSIRFAVSYLLILIISSHFEVLKLLVRHALEQAILAALAALIFVSFCEFTNIFLYTRNFLGANNISFQRLSQHIAFIVDLSFYINVSLLPCISYTEIV
jgi:hypothetical protein